MVELCLYYTPHSMPWSFSCCFTTAPYTKEKKNHQHTLKPAFIATEAHMHHSLTHLSKCRCPLLPSLAHPPSVF